MRAAFSFFTSAALHALLIALLWIAGITLPRVIEAPAGRMSLMQHAFTSTSAPAQRDPAAGMIVELSTAYSALSTDLTRSAMPLDVVEFVALPLSPDGQQLSPEVAREARRDFALSAQWDPQIAELSAPRRALQAAEYQVVVESFSGTGGSSDTAGRTTGTVVEQMPRPLADNPTPPYPADALAARQQGRVWLAVFVGSNGTVVNVRLSKTSGTPSLDNSALATMYQWRFTPARRGSETIAFEVLVPVRFEIVAARKDNAD